MYSKAIKIKITILKQFPLQISDDDAILNGTVDCLIITGNFHGLVAHFVLNSIKNYFK